MTIGGMASDLFQSLREKSYKSIQILQILFLLRGNGRCAQNLTKSLRKSVMICGIFNQIYFDFERSDHFNKDTDLSHEIKKRDALEKGA